MRGQAQSKKSYGSGLRTYQKQLPYSFSSWSFECFFTVFRAIPVAFLWYVFFSELALSDMVEKGQSQFINWTRGTIEDTKIEYHKSPKKH